MWIADKIAYRGEENFSMAYKGRVLVWFKEGTNIIHYTSTDGQVINPGTGGALGGFGANIVSNTYENGVGTIVFDGPVRAIAGSGFSNKSTLLSIDIPSTVTDLRAWCFSNCSSLTSLYIPANVQIFYLEWLENCPGLQSITVDPNNQKYMDLGCNGIYYYDGDGYLVLETGCKNTIIHRNTYSIDTAAFKGCSSLTSINLANVHFIGIDAFANCTSLTSITFPSSVYRIDSGAFSGSGLISIDFPSTISTINGEVCKGCPNLRTVIFRKTTPPSLGWDMFDDCPSLTQIKVPSGSVSAYKNNSKLSEYANKIVAI